MKRLPIWATLAVLACVLATPPAFAGDAGADICLARAQSILDALDAGEFEKARADFDERMLAGLPASQLEGLWKSLPAQAGPRVQVAPGRLQTAAGATVAIIPIQHQLAWLELQTTCTPAGKVSGLYVRPGQPPAAANDAASGSPSDLFSERDASVGSGALALPASLTLPRTEALAGVVLVHGSGSHDRNETIGPNQPFRDLAQGLAARGIAVLRYEKRSHAHPEAFAGKVFTVREEVIDDALAALDVLAATPELKGKPIYLVGHSLGAMLAPRIAHDARNLAGVVLLAAPARGLADIIPDQLRYLTELDGAVDAAERAKLQEFEAVLARVRKLSDAERNDPALILGAPAAYWLDLANYNPIAQSKRLGLPTLLLQGERDYQVTMAKDYSAWTAALKDQPWFAAHSFAGLSHLFMPAGDPPSPADYQKAAHVDPAVLDRIAAWIKTTAAQRPAEG